MGKSNHSPNSAPWSLTEKNYERIIELANLGLWKWSEFEQKEFYSPCWKRQLGYTDSNTDLDWATLLHEKDRTKSIQRFEQFKQGTILQYDSTFRLRCADGKYKWFLSRADIVQWSDPELTSGKPTALRIIGFHLDLSSILAKGGIDFRIENLIQ